MQEECTFRVTLREISAVDLKLRSRFKENFQIHTLFDDIKHKTEKQTVGGGDIKWNYTCNFEYTIYSWRFLDEKLFRVDLKSSADKKVSLGHLSVDLYTCATGPAEHNLPLVDFEGKTIGRLHFILEMEQVTNIAAIFKEVKVSGLKPPEGYHSLNPYLKYAFSVDWPKIQEGSLTVKAVYSNVEHGENPLWQNLPELRFKASLKEMLHESIVLHITNHGKLHNHTLGRCNLLFRTVVDNGKAFKEENLITFKGNLKADNATIEGTLYFKYLPKFAQMKSVSVIRKAVHTEKGIHDAAPLLPGLPLPKLPILNSEGTTTIDDSLIKSKPSGSELFDQKVAQMKERITNEVKNTEIPLPKKPEVKKEDPAPLISFDSPATPRNRSATVSGKASARQLPGFDNKNFVPPSNWANFGSNSNLLANLPPTQQQSTTSQQNQPFAFGGTPVAMQGPTQPTGSVNPFLQTPNNTQQTTTPQQQNASFNPFL